ncbi:MAG: hypothetical protein RIB47_05970 [Cyclobacteriaceae bacterium]
MIYKVLCVLALCLLSASVAYCQMAESLAGMRTAKGLGFTYGSEPSPAEKLTALALLPPGDSVQFELPDYDPEQYPDDPRYFPLDTAAIKLIDLDFDGDLDLLYTGVSRWQNLTDTKVYLKEEHQYQFLKIFHGRIIDIRKGHDHYEIHTLWVPCCDSYTSRIDINTFSASSSVSLESIFVIGSPKLRGMPDFESLPSGTITDASLFAFQDDFKGTSPYFRENNKHLRDSLMGGHPIQLIHLAGETKVKTIETRTIKGKKWSLVITETIKQAPKSLYEWPPGDRARFIGWVSQVDNN